MDLLWSKDRLLKIFSTIDVNSSSAKPFTEAIGGTLESGCYSAGKFVCSVKGSVGREKREFNLRVFRDFAHVEREVRHFKCKQFVTQAVVPDVVECLCDIENHCTCGEWTGFIEAFQDMLHKAMDLLGIGVIRSKTELLIWYYVNSLMVHANGTGDCGAPPVLSCHLCDGEGTLRRFGGTYLFDGVEENYDRMLFESFGVEVSRLDCMICDHCIHQLRNAHRFRNLVKAAFVKGAREKPGSDNSKTKPDLGGCYLKMAQAPKQFKPKVAIDNLQRRCELRREKQRLSNVRVETKKANVACTVCNQRYPMIVPFDGIKKFVCSRCKKNAETYGFCRKCNLRLPMCSMQEHLKTHARAKPKGKSRLCVGSKVLPSHSKTECLSRTQTYVKYQKKYQCSNCDKKYFVPQHLAHHISTVHGDILDCTCTVCGRDMKTRDKLDSHMRSHTGQPIYQCDICMKIFKSQRNLQTHYLSHEK